MKPSIALPLPLATSLSFGCAGDGPPAQGVQINESGTGQFKLEAWADNWFSVSLGATLLVEDSVSITTERSLNAEVLERSAFLDALVARTPRLKRDGDRLVPR